MKSQYFVTICRQLIINPKATQRELASCCGVSLGIVNAAVNECKAEGYLESTNARELILTEKGHAELEQYRVRNAIILAAGFGARCVPMTYETPKGLLNVFGKPAVERQIEQLLDKGITDIIVVVGYLKEKFDYLIDKYGVKLVYNPEYATKNNLASLWLVREKLANTYVCVSDNYIKENIFNEEESVSWFSCPFIEGKTNEWIVTKKTKSGIIREITIGSDSGGYAIQGPVFFSVEFSERFKYYLEKYYNSAGSENYYFEHILKDEIRNLPPLYIKDTTGILYEFEDFDELRKLDPAYNKASDNEIIKQITEIFNVPIEKIHNIYSIKAGVTNMSFHFAVDDNKYVFRVPGVGTDKLIDRKNEKLVYDAIGKLKITDEIVSFDAKSGYKITHFIEDARNSDPFNDEELDVCMKLIRPIHESGVTVPNSFSIDSKIDYYLSLAEEMCAVNFSDINKTKEKVQELLEIRRNFAIPEVLCHGDYAHINVLMLPNGTGRLIDFEYSGMADPLMDIAMYAIFAEFDKERIDLSLRMYLGREPDKNELIRCYMYVALGGFLWCMWSQYKQALGQEFGEYPLTMYRYMKDYYNLVMALTEQTK